MRSARLFALGLLATVAFVLFDGTSRTFAQSYPVLALMPLENPSDGITPTPFREGCLNMNLWPTVAGRTQLYGDADWAVAMLSPSDQAACFQNLNNAGIKLALEVPVLKDWCQNADACFDAFYANWQVMSSNGAQLGALFLDEPLTAVNKGWLPGDFSYAVAQTKRFIERVRQVPEFASVSVISIEAYPFNNTQVLYDWIAAVGSGSNVANYFEVDQDGPQGPDPASDLHNFQYLSHYYGMGFGLLYFWSNQTSFDDYSWYSSQDFQCYTYSALPGQYDITADLYHVSAFYHTPRVTASEDQAYSFMYSAKYLQSNGCLR